MRLGGDWVLYYAMLKRLLREFHDIGRASTGGDSASLAALAQRMHKLRGSAGMLGVNTVQQLAAEAEQACKEGPIQKIQQLLRKLDLQMHTLQQSALPYLDSYDKSVDAELAVPSAPLSPEDLTGLCELLKQQNMLAIDRFEELAAQIKLLLGPEQFARLRDDMDNLQFNHAAQALVALRA